MKLNLTDGHVISPYIIWGELDYRGYVALGFELEKDFHQFEKLDELSSRKQLICHKGKNYLFISLPLAIYSPKGSIFNLPEFKLLEYYKETYEKAQDELWRLFYRLKHLTGQELKLLKEDQLLQIWNLHFNPIISPIENDLFNPSETILTNCIPEQNIKASTIGFSMNGCLHHFIAVSKFSSYEQVLVKLKDFPLTVNLTENGNQIFIHLHGENISAINQLANQAKSIIHSIPDTDYFEANDAKENMRLFCQSVPGWIFEAQKELAAAMS